MFHILVVDDDKHTRMLLRAVLENAHYTVTTATNGEEALEALDKEHIDLVVLDIMMPKWTDMNLHGLFGKQIMRCLY